MKTEIKEYDHFNRDYMVSYNFTVRTNGYNSWKINVVIRCENERLEYYYFSNSLIIDSYMTMSGNESKGLFLRKNMPIDIQMDVFSWLSDFPRYHIIEKLTLEKLAEARTKNDAEDEQNDFMIETVILDTWSIK